MSVKNVMKYLRWLINYKIAILTIKGVDHRCVIWNITKNDAINKLSNAKLDKKSSL